MSESKGFMGHYGLEFALSVPGDQVKGKIIELTEKEKRGLRIMQREKAKIRRQKEDERRERFFK